LLLLILNAPNTKAVCSVVGVHVSTSAVEVQVASICTANRTTPVVAVATYIVKRSITVVAVACNNIKKHILSFLLIGKNPTG